MVGVQDTEEENELIVEESKGQLPLSRCLQRHRVALARLERVCGLAALVLLAAAAHFWLAHGPEDLLWSPLARSNLATVLIWAFAGLVCLVMPLALFLRLEDARIQEGSGSSCIPVRTVLLLAFPPLVLVLLVITEASACVKGRPVQWAGSACLCDRVVATGTPAFGHGVPADLTLAFVGDSSIIHGDEVLKLLRAEGTSAVVFNGDAAYAQQNADWLSRFRQHLGTTPFYVAAGVGSPDELRGVQQQTQRHWAESNVTECRGEIGVRSTCTHRGVGLMLSGAGDSCGASLRSRTAFFEKALSEFTRRDVLWPICVFDFHSNERHTGTSGWDNYKLCLQRGALIITAHRSPYTRTHEVDRLSAGSPHVHVSRRVEPGSNARDAGIMREGHSMVVFTGLDSLDGLSANEAIQPDHGTGEALHHHGAFFCRFHVHGDPSLARCYYKDMTGQVADDFYLRREVQDKGVAVTIV